MRSVLGALLVLTLCAATAMAQMEVYFAPDGGFAPSNRNRVIVTPDGKQLSPTLNNAVRDLVERVQPGGEIKIAMYAFSDKGMQDMLIKAAFERRIRVKLILDGVADWTKDIRRDICARVAEERKKAPGFLSRKFQIKVIYPGAFVARGRVRRLKTGEDIFGTMHEKFGVFYQPGMRVPFDSFGGSSNISYGSDQNFAENRFVFRNDPVVARQYAEEFARLWNEYGTDALGNAESEPYIPADPVAGSVGLIFNGEPVDEERYHQIDEEILRTLDKVRYKDGTIDIFMFSWTHFQIAERLLEIAQRFPTVRIRVLMDQTQLVADEERRGVLGPYLEDKAKEIGLTNFEIRYKWRSNVFFWEEPELSQAEIAAKAAAKNAETTADSVRIDPAIDGVPGSTPTTTPPVVKEKPAARVAQIHWRNLILHHKVLMVNRNLMVAGSYNWSSSAERRNLENVMIFNGAYPGHQGIVDRMEAEFDFLWESLYSPGPFDAKVTRPQVVTGPQGRERTALVIATLEKPNMKPIMELLDRQDSTFDEIVRATRLKADIVRTCLQDLVQAGMIFSQNGKKYGLAD